MVYLEDPSRKAIIEALRKRHCYGATDNIILEVTMGNHMMGDIFESKTPAHLDITVKGTGTIKSVDIMKNSEIVHTINPRNKNVQFNWKDSNQNSGESWYYVRVVQEDGEIAWGSPMWITLIN